MSDREVQPETSAKCSLRDRYAEAIHRGVLSGWVYDSPVERSLAMWDPRPTADAVLAVRDDVRAEKDAEIERLTSERDKAREECGHEKAMRAHLREELNTFVRLATERKDRAEAAEAEVARQRETVPEWLSDVERLARNIYYTTGADRLRFGRLDAAAQDRYREMARKIAKHLPALAPSASAPEAPRTRDGEQGGEREVGGIAAIAAERRRQIEEKGYTAEHDERHPVRQFVATALAYLGAPNKAAWPIKRADPESDYFQRRDLVKAGALIAAAIDRLDEQESR